jgi:hypothetical protein
MADDYFDLIVWYEPDGNIHGFQLCYDRASHPRAFTWTPDFDLHHAAVDSGESGPARNSTPLLIPDPHFPIDVVEREFLARSVLLSPEIRHVVQSRLIEYRRRLLATSDRPLSPIRSLISRPGEGH